ncbi:hypothetical protein OJAV_G00017040 [Oryzias javanicus]|uniref:TFIIS central domain-containing protein n=1 Tax=Oryzias javanicus TaxID=123683 RepID=A0A3S2Q0U5_ORYJA|nr:hypothetical protein OJAV_G00017040 [Oryzias javanicus]
MGNLTPELHLAANVGTVSVFVYFPKHGRSRASKNSPPTMKEISSAADRKEFSQLLLQVEKISAGRSFGDVEVLLNKLEKFRVTAEELHSTGLESALLGLLRSSEDPNLREKLRGLLRRWRRRSSRGGGGGGGVKDQLSSTGSPGGSEEAGSLADPVKTEVEASQGEPERRPGSSDPARTKCVQLLLAALLPDLPGQDQAAELAGAIEEHIHQLHKPNQLRYKNCVRSKVSNLKNPKNPHLRRGLLGGSLLPDTFARMSAEEMAGPELRSLRQEICERGVSERQLPWPAEGTPTQKVRCRRCGGSDCRVTQLSRGALFLPAWVRRGGPDEDAMTFVTCSVCGQQWYHSSWNCL